MIGMISLLAMLVSSAAPPGAQAGGGSILTPPYSPSRSTPETRWADPAERAWLRVMDAVASEDAERLAAAAARALPILRREAADPTRRSPARDALNARLGFVLAVLGRRDQSREAFAVVSDAMRRDAAFIALRLDAAARAEDLLGTLEGLELAVATQGDAPDGIVADLSEELVLSLNAALADDPPRDRLAAVLIAANWNRDAGPGNRDWLFMRVLTQRMIAGDLDGAIAILDRIEAPQSLLGIFVQDRFAALHPLIERRHGADLGLIAERYEARLERAHRAAPSEDEIVGLFAQHLSETGQYARALVLIQSRVDDIEWVRGTGVRGFSLVNSAADAELALGRGDAALARMDRLLTLGLEENPALISQAINRAGMLDSLGRHRDALVAAEALAERSESAAERGTPIASAYGDMWIWSIALCAAHELGLADRVRHWRARLEAAPRKNEAAVMRAYLCAEDMEAAERLALVRLNGDAPADMLKVFQRSTFSASRTPRDARLQRRGQSLLERPAVRAAVERVGRVGTFVVDSSYWGEF